MISNVPEAPSNLVGDQRLAHDIQYLSSDKVKMNPNEISTCFRAGRVKKKMKKEISSQDLLLLFLRVTKLLTSGIMVGRGLNVGYTG